MAYGRYGYYGRDDEMSGFAIFTLIVMIAYIILSIIVLVRWWNMTANIERIHQQLTHSEPNQSLAYIVAIGEKERAEKIALKMLVDDLGQVYDGYYIHRAEIMDEKIAKHLSQASRLGLSLPDYVTSGEKFIDYMNSLTGGTVPYKETNPNQFQV